MMSKKEAAMLGLLAVGGIGAALMISGKGGIEEGMGGGGLGLGLGEEEPEAMTKKETVAETYTPMGVPAIEAPHGFFAIPETIKTLIAPKPSVPAKKVVKPYLYTGGEVKQGAYSVIPSAATGVQPYLYTGGEVKLGAFTRVGRGGGLKKASAAQMSSTAARRKAFATLTRYSRKK